MALGGLGDEEVVELVHAVAELEIGDAAVNLAHEIRRETGGNPFFTGEVLRHLFESGAFTEDGSGNWQVEAERLESGGLPDSVREVVRRRMARLGDATGRVLGAAAVIGVEFDLDVLALVTDRGQDELLALLEPATQGKLVVESDSPGQFAFAHALVAHALYDDLGPTRRQRTHRRVGEALEALYGDNPGNRIGDLARHWAAATGPGEPSRAVEYARRAGDAALAALAPAEATRWYAQALDLLPSGDPAGHIDLLIDLGRAQRQAGSHTFRETLLDAAHRANALGDTSRLVAAALANTKGFFTAAGKIDDEKVAVLEAALLTVDADESSVRARLLATLCTELTFGTSVARRVQLADEAGAAAHRSDDPATIISVSNLVDPALFLPEMHDRRMVETAQALDLALELGDPPLLASAAACRSGCAFRDGSLDEVDRCLDILSSVLHRANPATRTITAGAGAVRRLVAGDHAGAERLGAHARDLAAVNGAADGPATYAALLLGVRWQQGRLAELTSLIAQTATARPEMPHLAAALAMAHCEADRYPDALVQLGAASVGAFSAIPLDVFWMTSLTLYAEVAIQCRAAEPAAVLRELLAPWHALTSFSKLHIEGPVAHYLGGLADVVHRYDEAEAWFREAAEVNRNTAARFFSARTDLAWATMLRNRGAPGDAERGRTLAQRARRAGQQWGYANIERRAGALVPD
ncbi:MAG: hypothetical protein NVSMB12_13940 [Acidimicrobiales bacterium]